MGRDERGSAMDTAQSPQVYISYSRRNKDFADTLYRQLTNTGLNVWIDTESVPYGSDWQQVSRDALRNMCVLAVVITPASVGSEGVRFEWTTALALSVPILPIYEMPIFEVSVMGLVDFVTRFVHFKGYGKVHLVGNSLGGHVAQLYVLQHPEKVKTLLLTGSSGLFENSLGDAYPRKGDYEYVRKKAAATFYNPAFATKELVDEVYAVVNDRARALRMVVLAKSALRHNLRERVPELTLPVCLIWGKEDSVTPAFVGEAFHKLLKNAELHLIEQCGHAPMMEHPERFNQIMERFLDNHS